MTRFASSTNATEAAKLAVRVAVLVDLDFASGHVRAHDGVGSLTFGGNTYTGVGTFGGIQMVTEDLAIIAKPCDLSISGVDPSLISTAMTEHYQGRAATVYFGLLDPETNVFVDTPETAWDGRMDYMEIQIDQGSATIALHCEHRLRREPNYARNTDEDQQQRYSGDRFFKMLNLISGFRSQWGQHQSQYGNGITYVRGPRGIPIPVNSGG